MTDIRKIADEKVNKIVFITKVLILISTLITDIPIMNSAIRDIYKVFYLWSFCLLVFLFFRNKKHFFVKEYIVLFIFSCSYVVTIFVNHGVHLVNEAAILLANIMLFFMLTYIEKDRKEEDIKHEMIVLAYIYMAISFVYGIINLFLLFGEVSGRLDMTLYPGLYALIDNRLGGLYNPNTGATISYLSFIISFIVLKCVGKHKALVIINMIMQLMCFYSHESRGSWICVFAFVAGYVIFALKTDKFKGAKNVVFKAVTLIVTIALLVFGDGAVRSVLWNSAYSLRANVSTEEVYEDDNSAEGEAIDESEEVIEDNTETVTEDEVSDETEEVKDVESDQKEETIASEREKKDNSTLNKVLAGRVGVWWVGIWGLYQGNVAFGTGYRSIDDIFQTYMSESLYNDVIGGGLHNAYITVLVAAGVVGIVLFALFIIFMLIKIIKLLFAKNVPEYVKCVTLIMPVMMVGELVESRIIFGTNSVATVFWLTAGLIMYFEGKYKNGKCNNSTL